MKLLFNKTKIASLVLGAMLLLGYQSNAQCTADFNWSANGSNVSFTDASTANSFLRYSWQFGDGGSSSTENPMYVYQQAGTYTACLYIYDTTKTCFDSICKQVTVTSGNGGGSGGGCRADFYATPTGLVLALKNYSKTGSSNATYLWTFGDGTSSTQTDPSHTYTTSGNYTVCLILTDSACSDTTCQVCTVGNKHWLKGDVSWGNNSNAPDYGNVWAIQYDSTAGTLTAVDSTITDSIGNYVFYLPSGNYLVKAALDSRSSSYSNYLPTYHGNKLHWDSATKISLFTHKSGIDIHLTTGNNPGGPGFIGGHTSQGANKTGAVGDPIEGVEIVLYDDQKNPIAYTYSDNKGAFAFSNLKYGTYKVYPEILNKTALPMVVTLSTNRKSVSDVVVEVNSKYSSVALGVVHSQQPIDNSVKVYPNPANSILNIELEGNTAFNTKVTDMQGRSIGLSAAQEGNRMRLDVSSLASGMYILNLTAKDGSSYRQRIVKQ